jgi:hypothetical protein
MNEKSMNERIVMLYVFILCTMVHVLMGHEYGCVFIMCVLTCTMGMAREVADLCAV